MSTAAAPAANVDQLIIHKLIEPGQTIVDVSAGGSEWLNAALALHAGMRALFYASQASEIAAFSSSSADQSRVVHQGSVNTDGSDLDGDTLREGIRHIHYLHIGSTRAVRRVLKGATRLLSHSRIDFIQFPLDTFDIWTIQTVNQLLVASGYEVFEILHEGGQGAVTLKFNTLQDPARVHKTVQIIATHQRMVPLVALGEPNDVLFRNGFAVALTCGVQFRGLIQVGAFDGAPEYKMLKMLGFRHALLIEANPTPFFQLKQNWKDAPYATVVNCAILDTNGPVEFTITNQGESSSLLKPARALEELFIKEQLVFKEEGIITVPGRTLDYLLKEWNMLPQWFNVLVIDIQGAELLALKGAASLLPHLDMVNIEVNFEELYRNGAQIDEIDDFLAPYRFRRVYTVSTRRAWADALYVKEQFAGSVRVETPSCLSLLFGGDASPVKLAIHPNVSI